MKFVKEEYEEKPVVPKKKAKKEKVLSEEEIQHQEYLSRLPILQARTAPTALHTAISRINQIDMKKFLADIGFSSFSKFAIDYIPSRLGRYVVSNFDGDSCRLNLEGEKWIEATVSKVHELFGIPIGGVPLLARPDGDEFLDVWKGQFDKVFKDLRVNDIANKLIESNEVDFLFKVNFLTLFTNTMGMCAGLKGEINLDVVRHLREDTDIPGIDWCDYILHCLKTSKAPTTFSNKYTGPYTFLALLYLDSTKYEKLPVARKRPVIKEWSSHLMAQREKMELNDECIGDLELYGETDLPEEAEGFVSGGSSDPSFKEGLLEKLEDNLTDLIKGRTSFEELLGVAESEFPDDSKVIELHKKYVQIFKRPVSLTSGDLVAKRASGKRPSGT